jgi:hypothetical protein
MISSSQLSDEQKQALAKWAEEGASIADLQRRLKDEFSLSATYMDTRFLVLDLGLSIREPEPDGKSEEPAAEESDQEESSQDEGSAPGETDGVSVTVDEIAVPGALVSGKVVFSDGEKAIWMLDQMGRPSLDPDTAGYRPSEEDIMDFQVKLRDILSRHAG